MAYSTAIRPFAIVVPVGGGFGGGSSDCGCGIWGYRSTDTLAAVATTGYFTDGNKLGMRVNDIVNFIRVSTAFVPQAHHTLVISSVSTNGASPTILTSSSS